MTRQQRSQQARAKWRKLVSEQAKSGQSVAVYCRERGLCAPQFFAWKRKLSAAVVPRFVEVKLAASLPSPVGAGAGIEVRLKNDVRLVVGPGFDADHLRALLAVLAGAA